MSNKVTYGLEKVHLAIKGISQVESIEVLTGCGTDGEITVTVTGAPLTGSSEACIVPLSTESHGTAAKVASAVANVLKNNADVGAAYDVRVSGAVIYLRAKIVAANDATLAIAFTPGSTGVTVGSSTNVAAGAVGWGVPQAVPGAVRLTPSAEGKDSTFWADNGPYWVQTSNNGYSLELEMALIPDALLAELLGWLIDDNGALIEISDATPKPFALLGEIEGDERDRRFVYYDCIASRPAKEQKTSEEMAEPNTDVLNLKALPIEIDSRKIVMGTLELSATNTTAYNAWFDAVYVPVVA